MQHKAIGWNKGALAMKKHLENQPPTIDQFIKFSKLSDKYLSTIGNDLEGLEEEELVRYIQEHWNDEQ